MKQMFITNEPHMSCCGNSRSTCNCGGNGGQAPNDDPGYVYSGRYSRFWTPEQEAERQREEAIANDKPTPMELHVWNFRNEFVDDPKPVTAPEPAATRQEHSMYAGMAFGEGVTNRRNDDVPTPMPLESWTFQNEFSSNRR
ncbi:hypothetical protein [Lacipirellula parvula]|uniref:Uncharacterized protein n=1 Tax=Lacipirellula parvula TaxID=2650471 RepID=A0A5K7X713_9BACT|nr:hypothetical protein [Lacipirellula parvula]BBO32380.1 hypothetical protein PLANPX_1992 [Lacipirellula parvula]